MLNRFLFIIAVPSLTCNVSSLNGSATTVAWTNHNQFLPLIAVEVLVDGNEVIQQVDNNDTYVKLPSVPANTTNFTLFATNAVGRSPPIQCVGKCNALTITKVT